MWSLILAAIITALTGSIWAGLAATAAAAIVVSLTQAAVSGRSSWDRPSRSGGCCWSRGW